MTLATTDPTVCPDCGAVLTEIAWAQDALFFHGGYGGTERRVARHCVCGWHLNAETATERPPRPTNGGPMALTDERTPAVLDWHGWRSRGIGASDIAGIVLPSKWSSPWKVWAEKVGLLAPTDSTQRQRIGQRMEAVLAAEFEDARTGLMIVGEQTWCEHPEHPWARCTVDGFVAELEACGEPLCGGCTPGSNVAVVEFKTDARYGWPEGPPPNYRAQCIWAMGVTGKRHAFLAVMFGGFRFEVFDIPWDTDAQADWDLMFAAAQAFWFGNVLTGVPPTIDGSDATADALAAVYPDHTPGVTVDLEGMAGLLAERDDLKDRSKANKARIDEIENEIKARLGDAEVGEIAGIPVVTYRTQSRAEYVSKASTFRVLRNAPAPKKGKP